MNIGLLFKNSYLKNWLVAKIGYFSEELYELDDSKQLKKSLNAKKVVIVAKRHYDEVKESIPSISKAELKKLIRLKKESKQEEISIYHFSQNNAIDGYDVKTIVFDNCILNAIKPDSVLIPETELLSQEASNEVLDCETPSGKLYAAFFNNKVSSAYQKGVINNINAFKMSAGVPNKSEVRVISLRDYPAVLLEALWKTELKTVQNKAFIDLNKFFDLSKLHLLYFSPLLITLGYYALTNSYFYSSIATIEENMEKQGTGATQLLGKKREIDAMQTQLASMVEETSNAGLIHYHWNVIDKLLMSGTTITRITYKNEELIVRASAKKASVVLAELNNSNIVKSASFYGPVRTNNGLDAFVLKILP